MTEQEFEYKLKDMLTEFRIAEELQRLEHNKEYAGLFDTKRRILDLIKQAGYAKLAKAEKEKPDVISAERIGNIWETWAGIDCPSFEEAKTLAVTRLKAIAQAQRDADATYYEPHVEFYKSAYEVTMKAAKSLKAKQDTLIQQAKADVAREIFEEAETLCIHYGSKNNRWVKRCCDECWQSLKDKWLKELLKQETA